MCPDEAETIRSELSPAFEVIQPANIELPFIFNSPHSGRRYPKSFLAASKLDPVTLRRSEDCYVDELFDFVAELGAPMLIAHFPRAYLDVNREPYELDPVLFGDRLPEYANTQSVRVVGGLGTIARIVSESEEIYREPLSIAAAMERINRIYTPYHETLNSLLLEAKTRFGTAVLIDCHSMPSTPMADNDGGRPDFVLGDRYGTSCHPALMQLAAQELRALGYAVSLNKPYAGGYITEHYGSPDEGRHVLQIEINRALYMDELSFRKRPGFDRLRSDLKQVVEAVMEFQAECEAPFRAPREVPKAAAE
ncbi:N-formylglutamate amidohydrolase [Methyloligella halotolerans]|uniref:N-formylglutamate amidohydrolase n=1 Tax=Methyloligella halotolerans TaxID=1177755 RepID=A0A1E2RZB0_9HYPH|nr:N-formylglutamate amidohydrolase [Methyloligella halotolerans]ODA67492.1 N-formylglutamate amidohydrolase [Methyloligella halotolerans]